MRTNIFISQLHWSHAFLGLPYRVGGRERNGIDCWGLVQLVYREKYSIELPELPGVTTENLFHITSEVDAQRKDWEEIEKPVDGCAVAMSCKTAIHHVGIWVDADGGKVLHCWDKARSSVETIRKIRMMGINTIRFYLHHGFHH